MEIRRFSELSEEELAEMAEMEEMEKAKEAISNEVFKRIQNRAFKFEDDDNEDK